MPFAIGTSPGDLVVHGQLGGAAYIDPERLPVSAPQQAALDGKQPTLPAGSLGLKLITALTPTAAANLDFLSVFTAAYDSYLIIGTGLNFAADNGLNLRLAKAGAADTTNAYIQTTPGSGESASALSTMALSSTNVRSAGKGANFRAVVSNVNSASALKTVSTECVWNSNVGGPGYTSVAYQHVYFSADVVTGFRLHTALGGNFAAQGKILVYGYSNT